MREIIGVQRAEKAEAVGEHLDDALANDVGFSNRELTSIKSKTPAELVSFAEENGVESLDRHCCR